MPSPSDHPSAPTVFLVDDDVSFLRSLSRFLRAAGFRVVVHNSAAEFLGDLKADMNGCVITDLRMPGMDGMGLQRALQQAGSPLPILFLSAHGDIPSTVQAMRGGAEDFLTKHAPKAHLLAAVKRALAHNEMKRAEQAHLQALRRPFESLTEREREVLRLVVQGKMNKEIAAGLGIHERTVKLHRTHITIKLGVRSVAELARLVHEAGVQ